MATGLTNKEKQKLAYALYFGSDMLQKEIAEAVGCTESSIGKWIKEGGWEELKLAETVTNRELIIDLYMQLKEINSVIKERDKGLRYATTSETDSMIKITKVINTLNKKLNLTAYSEALKDFMHWLKDQDMEAAKEFVSLQKAFLQTKARELKN